MKINITKIRLARMIRGWSQRDLAREIGMSPGTITNLEKRGTVKPSTLKKISEALGIPMQQLIGGNKGQTKKRS
jgi:transcriptional regulator with XRE-family HTH domain